MNGENAAVCVPMPVMLQMHEQQQLDVVGVHAQNTE
jgi:hypothetical protein